MGQHKNARKDIKNKNYFWLLRRLWKIEIDSGFSEFFEFSLYTNLRSLIKENIFFLEESSEIVDIYALDESLVKVETFVFTESSRIVGICSSSLFINSNDDALSLLSYTNILISNNKYSRLRIRLNFIIYIVSNLFNPLSTVSILGIL